MASDYEKTRWIMRNTVLCHGQDMGCFLPKPQEGEKGYVAISTEGEAVFLDPDGPCLCKAGREEPHRHEVGYLTAEQIEEAAVAGIRAYLKSNALLPPGPYRAEAAYRE